MKICSVVDLTFTFNFLMALLKIRFQNRLISCDGVFARKVCEDLENFLAHKKETTLRTKEVGHVSELQTQTSSRMAGWFLSAFTTKALYSHIKLREQGKL